MKKISRMFSIFIILGLVVGTISANPILAYAEEEIIQHNVVYSEDHTKAVIGFDVSSVDTDKYEIKSITQNEVALSLDEPTYEVDKNGEVEFKVTYIEKKQDVQDNKDEENINTSENDENINDKQEEINTEDLKDQKQDTSETNLDLEKEKTITVKVDGIFKVEEPISIEPNVYPMPQSTSIQTSDRDGNIDLKGTFDISATYMFLTGSTVQDPNWDTQMLKASGDTLQMGNKQFADEKAIGKMQSRMLSKFTLDMNQSFSLKGSLAFNGDAPDGFALGLIDISSTNIYINSTEFSGGGYLGIYELPIYRAIVYEIDTYSNNGLDSRFNCLDEGFPYTQKYPHTMISTINKGVASRYTAPVPFNYNTIQDSRDLIIEYDKATDILKFSYGAFVSECLNAKQIIGTEAKFFVSGVAGMTDKNIHAGYNGGYMGMDIQIKSFNYTVAKPISDTKYYTKRNGTLIEFDANDLSSYPSPGETVLVRNTINNDFDNTNDQSTTANISDFKLDGTTISPDSIKMYTGTPDSPVEVPLDQTDIFNGSMFSNGTFKQATVPLLANKGKTYLEYEYTIPANQKYSKIDNTIIFGQKGMTQYPFSSSVTIANTPELKGIDKTIVSKLGTGNMSDMLIRKDIEGKLFDAVDFTPLVSDTGDMLVTYTVDGSDTKKIDMSHEGRYLVAYTLEDIRTGMKSTETRTIWVTDKDVDVTGDENIAAQDFVLLTKEVSATTFMDTLQARSGIEAYDKDGNAIAFKDITVTQSMKPTFGTYPVTFTTKAGTTMTVNCRVYDNGNVNDTNQEAIYANDFSLSETEAITAEDSVLINLSKVTAFSTIDRSDVTVKVQANTIKGKTQGLYDVTFVSDKGTSVTVKGRITKYSDEQNGERITANDFSIDAMSAKHKDPKQLIALAKAEAVKTDTQEKVEVIVDASALKGVKGSYNVIFKTAGGASVTTTAMVLEKGGENPDPTLREAIYANNFNLTSKQVIDLIGESTPAQLTALIGYANAQAMNIDSGDIVAITKVDSDFQTKQITDGDGTTHTVAIEGLYDITFHTAKGTSVKVKASVPSSVENDTLLLYANGFTISKSDVGKPLTEADYLKLAKAQAYVKADDTAVTVKVLDTSAIQAKAGTYKIQFGTDYPTDSTKDLTLEVLVTVVENGIDHPSNDESIRANDIYLKLSDVDGLTSNQLIGLAKAYAYQTSTGAYVDLEAIYDIKKKAGTYEVTFETALGTSLKVKAFVFDEGTIDNGEAIYANDFTMSLHEANLPSEAFLKQRAQVKAYNVNTLEAASVTSVTHSIIQKKGSYEVTFETAAGTQVKVQANVVENGITVGNETINANDIYMNKDDVSKLTEAKVLRLSNAMAYNNVTNERLALSVNFTNVLAKKGTYEVSLQIVGSATALPIKAHVFDEGTSDVDKHTAIYANDFMLSKQEAKTIGDTLIKKLTNVKAMDTDTNMDIPLADIAITHHIEDKVGVYDVTFTVKGVSITVKATVLDGSSEANGERITANHFAITLSEFDTLDEDKVIERAYAKAYTTVDGTEVKVKADYTLIEKKKGSYNVIFKTDTVHATSITVQVEVFDQGTIDSTNKEMIYANDFSLSKKDVRDVTLQSLIDLAHAKAYNMETGTEVTITNAVHTLVNAKGVYPVRFETTKQTKVSVQATVVENEVVNPDKNERIIANDFAITKDQVSTLNDASIIALANAKAYDTLTGNEIAIPQVTHAIEAKKGVYQVTLGTANDTLIIVEARVYDSSVVNPDNGETIYANDFNVSREEAKNISDTLLKQRSSASAIKTDTGVDVKITKVTHSIKEQPGVYDVSFKTLMGTSITVKANVYDEGVVSPDGKEYIHAFHFGLSKNEVNALTEDILKAKARVTAHNTETNAEIAITNIRHNIEAEVGVYDVTYTTANMTSITVKATVYENVNVDPTNNEAIYANHFALSKEEAKNVSDALLKKRSSVQAWNTSNGVGVDITSVEQTIQAEVGSYDVCFKTAAGTSITVQAEVYEKGIENPTTKETMNANDINVTKQEVAGLSDDILKAKAKVSAHSSETNAEIAITKVTQNIEVRAGTYEVSFYTAKGTSITVKATVFDTGTVDPNTNEAIYANDISLEAKEVDGLSEEVMIQKAEAKAIDLGSGKEVAITKVIHNVQKQRGTYVVGFRTAKDTALEVSARVYETVVPDTGGNQGSGSNGKVNGITRGNKNEFLRVSTKDATNFTITSEVRKEKKDKVVSSQGNKNQKDEASNQNKGFENCYTHWGMVAIIALYVIGMLVWKRRDDENE